MRWTSGGVVPWVAAAGLVGGLLCRTVIAEPLVAGFERFGRTATSEVERIEAGLLLVGELGCTSCHGPTAAAAAHLLPKPAPRLDRAGERLDPVWVAAYLRDPAAAHPGTTMPQALAGLDDAARESTVEALVHHLAASGPFDRRMPDGGGATINAGVAIYRQSGCQVCHGERFSLEPLADQRALGDLAAKWSPRALERFLDDPHQTRPGGRMPPVGLSADERRHLVAALVADRRLWHGEKSRRVAFRGRAWHRAVKQLPDIDNLGAADRAGPVTGLEVEAFAERNDDFVVRLEGWLHVPVAGEHRFHLASDDGSRLVVGDTTVVTVDGVHPREEREGSVTLVAGIHPLRLDFFEAGGGCELDLEITPPGGLRQPALPFIVPERDAPPPPGAVAAPAPPAFTVDPVRAAAGHEAFVTHGCAACHGPVVAAAPRPPLAAPPLAALAGGAAAGCIGPAPARGRPFYPLDDVQRDAMLTALAWLARPAAAAAAPRETRIGRTLVALNCLTCHPRDGRGGVLPAPGAVDEDGEPLLRDAARDRLFTGPLPEMGDEGRLPPTLDGVGDKLRPEFLRTVLVEGGGDRRATMHTRMPRWPVELAGPLADWLAADPQTVVAVPALSGHGAPQIADAARELVGSKGLGCIKCHAFAGDRGQGLGAIDMTRFDDRLRHEWFLAYVADPQVFRPGTRMPASWPAGKVFFPAVLGGSAPDQIEAVWRYVGAATPRPPLGLGNDPIELVADDRPVIYRNFIEGGGPRGIAVGYPEKVNLTWDAEAFRLALAWRDAFIDARRHWSGRGEGFQPPLGQGVIVPDSAAAIAVLEEPGAAWPAESPRARGGRFRGYVLDAAGRPEFRWTLGELEVREAFMPRAGASPRLVRRLTLTGLPAAGRVVFRPAVARRVEPTADGRLRIDDAWTCAVSGDVGPVERVEREGRIELRHAVVPQPDASGRPTAVVEEEIGW